MKKIVRQQNYLKELIESQENKFLSRLSLRALIRAVLEPLLDKPGPGVVLHRIIKRDGVLGLLKRLEFSDIESFDFTDGSENLREKVWANTEFFCVMTHRFVAIILWDNNAPDERHVRYYAIVNSSLQNEALDIINRNSIIDIGKYQEKFKPDRRDNILLNSSFRRLLANLDESARDAVLGFAEYQTVEPKTVQQTKGNVREIAHEVKNQLSICDLYSEIVRKYCAKNDISDETISNALDCITRAVKMANSSLVSLKSEDNLNLKPKNLKSLINSAKDLTKVYAECKNIEYVLENSTDAEILVDEDKFLAIVINLVKNAVEAFGTDSENELKNGKYVKIKTEVDGEFVLIKVSNNAGKILAPNDIFEAGYTTKSAGSGLGLAICKKMAEEQSGEIKLTRNDDDCVEFTVKFATV